jgi:2C-methyl-D-erythritol 2,4-cyclodiphosphate synthase
MLDTLTLADRLTDAGVEQKQANAIAHAIHDAQGETVTKGDIQHLATKADLERFATRADLERFATKADLQQVRTDLERCATKTDIATIETQMAAMESRLAWRVVGAVAVIGAILRFVG